MNPTNKDEGIIEKTKGIELKDLDLSTRLYNCLKRGGYSTLTELMLETPEKLSGLRNLGSVSERELFALRKFVYNADRKDIENYCAGNIDIKKNNNESDKQDWTLLEVAKGRRIGLSKISFISDDGLTTIDDLDISDLHFSTRTRNVLTQLGADTLKNTIFLPYQKLLGIKGLGKKSIDELITTIDRRTKITDIIVNDTKAFDYIIDILCELFQPIISSDSISERRGELIATITKVCGTEPEKHSLGVEQIIDIAKGNPLNKLLRDIILSKASNSIYNGVDTNTFILRITGSATYLNAIVSNTISQMIDDKQLRIVGGRLFRYKSFLSEWTPSLPEKNRIAVEHRCQGMTLDEIGKELNLTRERIRQIVAKTLKKRPALYEDDYANIINDYYLTVEELCGLFDISVEQANYLLLSYKRGSKDIQAFLADNSIPTYIKDRVARVMKGKVVIIDGECTPLKRDALLKQLLKTFYSEDECTVAEFETFYYDFLAENGIDEYEQLRFPNSRAFEARITDYSFTIAKAGHKIRYYETESIDINKLLDDIELDNYNDMEISTLKLFRDYPNVMDQYDIRDEYELHNLIRKKRNDIENYNVNVTRMPFICVGEGNRTRQVEELLYRMAPIPNVELASEYEHRYGVRVETVLANFFKPIDVYYHDGIFDIEQQELTQEEYKLLKDKLSEDFYLWSAIESIYLKYSKNPKADAINSMTLKKLGFRVYSQYVISAKYASAETYFKNLLLKNEVLLLDDLPRGIRNIQAYYAVLSDLRDDLELIEVRKNEYYRFSLFARKYAIESKSTLYNLGSTIMERIADYEYFSVDAISSTDVTSDLPNIVNNPYVLNSLLRTQPAIKTGRIADSYIGTKKNNDLSQLGLITHLVKTEGEININELINKLKEEYCLDLDRSRVMYVISGSKDITYDELYGYIRPAGHDEDGSYLTNGRYSDLISENYESIVRSETTIPMIYWKDKYSSFVEFCANKNILKMKDLLNLDFREISDNASKLNISRGTIPEIINQYIEWILNVLNDSPKEQETDILGLFFK